MVAAPLSTVDVNVDLPASTAQPAPRPDKPVFLTLKADLSLVLGEKPVKREDLGIFLIRRRKATRSNVCSSGLTGRFLWRDHGTYEHLADRRLFEDRAGRPGGRPVRRTQFRGRREHAARGQAIGDNAVGCKAVTLSHATWPAVRRFSLAETRRPCGAGSSLPLWSSLSMRWLSFGSCTSATCTWAGNLRRRS